MQLIQLKYEMIYEGFGGDKSRAPKIYLSENRLPMLSLIKQQIRQIGELLAMPMTTWFNEIFLAITV